MRQLAALAFASFLLLLSGALVALLVFERYQPLDAMAVLGIFSISILALWAWLAWKTWRLWRTLAEGMRQPLPLLGPAVLPWVFAFLLWLNATFDRSPPRSHPTVVVTKHMASASWIPAFRYEIVVESWRPGRVYEAVLLEEPERFHTYERGDAVLVEVRAGLLGLPWIAMLRRQ